jgi:hypothetical protein
VVNREKSWGDRPDGVGTSFHEEPPSVVYMPARYSGGIEPPTSAPKPAKIDRWFRGSTRTVEHVGVEIPGRTPRPAPRIAAATPELGT